MESFVCPHCKKTHEGLPTDYGFALPDDVWAIPESQRTNRAKWDSDLCRLDDRYFIRGLLPIRFAESDGYFGWGLWVEVDRTVFKRYLEIYELDASDEPLAEGTLANHLAGYPDERSCRVTLQFGPEDQRPIIGFFPTTKGVLADEYRTGMSSERYHDVLKSTGASEP